MSPPPAPPPPWVNVTSPLRDSLRDAKETSNLFWLSDEQWKRIEPHLPTDVRGVERADDRRVISTRLCSLPQRERRSAALPRPH
jgi:hypothetical protein